MPAVAEASAPAVDPGTVVEVVVAWGESVLHVAHLASANAAFSLGDRGNFALPAERLGTSRLDLVAGRAVLVPPHVQGLVALGEHEMTLSAARADGHLVDDRLPLARGVRLRFEIGGFTVQVAMVTAAEKLAGRGPKRRLAPWALALLLHAGTLGALASSPKESLDDEPLAMDSATRALLLAKTETLGGSAPTAAADVVAASPQDDVPHEVAASLVTKDATKGSRPAAPIDAWALVESQRFGALGALSEALDGRKTLDFGGFVLGRDPLSASPLHLPTAPPSEPFLVLGGGGFAASPCGCATKWAPLAMTTGPTTAVGAAPATDAPSASATAPATKVPIHAEATKDSAIERAVLARTDLVRGCFAAGRARDPGLTGTITARFVIDATGATESLSTSGGTLVDDGTRACVRKVLTGLDFPAGVGKSMVAQTWTLEEPRFAGLAANKGGGGCVCP